MGEGGSAVMYRLCVLHNYSYLQELSCYSLGDIDKLNGRSRRSVYRIAYCSKYPHVDGFVTYKKKIHRQHRRRFADIETISKR